jgi:hypothetical protein
LALQTPVLSSTFGLVSFCKDSSFKGATA